MTYKVQVEGEYMALWVSGERETSDIERARNHAAKFRLNITTEPDDVIIHAFDRFGNYSHTVSFEVIVRQSKASGPYCPLPRPKDYPARGHR